MATESVATEQEVTPEFCAAMNFDALLNEQQVRELEDCAKSFGVNRRIGYAILSKSKADLLKSAAETEESADAYFSMIEAFRDYKEHLNNLIQQTDTAEVRALCVLASLCEKEA